MKSDADVARALLRTWSHYVPFDPSPKQLAFSMLPHREALYGGAAGSGKSACLLMDALKFVEVPNYSAIIFRRSLTDLKRPGGLLDLAAQWLGPYLGKEVRYEASIHSFKWPNNASLTFGYVGSATAWEHYQGGSYQYIGWDELTQHSDIDYDEMFSRLRRNTCAIHSDFPDYENCPRCAVYADLQYVPLRVRGTTNPGGRGHFWVKKRFKLKKIFSDALINPVTQKPGIWVSGDPNRPFLAGFFTDNPGLDHKEYEKSLRDIASDERKAQLMEGDWDRIANGRYKLDWFKERWQFFNGYYRILNEDGTIKYSFHENQLRIYTVVDVACSVKTGVGEVSFRQAQGTPLEPSYTVIGTFGVTPKNEMLVLEIRRFREEAPQILDAIKDVCKKYHPLFVAMEVNGPGQPIAQILFNMGVPISEVRTFTDKISNSAESLIRCRAKKVLLPEEGTTNWDADFLGELAVWTGHPHEIADQVDVLSNAVHEFTQLAGNQDRETVHLAHSQDVPQVCSKHARVFDYPDASSLGGWWM